MKFSVLLTTTAAVVLAAPAPAPPGIPSPSDAKTLLADLQVATPKPGDGYSRAQFPHWITISGACDTRETVLKRDGVKVETNSKCASTSGTWVSPYDDATWTQASDVDIDHMVPLKNAWISGASEWTKAQRQAFANDLTRPQLWAVTDNVNQSKGDKSPDAWKPPLKSFYCTYAESWVQVKSFYKLTITTAEKQALGDMLNTC
ncbi:putative secreted protein [Cladobotryum mycophilum]|uniref:Secreted protein n=1 Tax=Cladobotryum mycophilum TaxID=491253 RepID=A0ABR0STS4_9HYPO